MEFGVEKVVRLNNRDSVRRSELQKILVERKSWSKRISREMDYNSKKYDILADYTSRANKLGVRLVGTSWSGERDS